MEIHISVRNLVEFLLRSGDIDRRKAAAPENAMQEGSRIHRMIQRRMGANYHAEVPLRYLYETPNYQIVIEGRADGIIEPMDSEHSDSVTIDEIKGTYRELHKMKEAQPVHLAQASCYAYFYAKQKNLASIRVRITYCHIETEQIRYFESEYTLKQLEEWFETLVKQYQKWADFQYEWQIIRQSSIRSLVFPFSYREGQKDLVTYVYQTIYHRKKLFVEAPTGVGKTISTIFPAIKAMGEGMGQRIFYLTAKTITRTVAEDTVQLLREQKLSLKSIVLTAKDKICFQEETMCNPVDCPYAKGHFDRINDAVYDLILHEDNWSREVLERYAKLHRVCPFELSLDASLFADLVICDYNYLFDPHVYLKRFFSEGVREEIIFLIDEAHNLVDRGREMYSACMQKEEFLSLKKLVKEYDAGICRQLDRCNKELLELKRSCEEYQCWEESDIASLVRGMIRLSGAIENYLEDHEDSPIREELLDFYFTLSHFLMIHENLGDDYVIYTSFTDENRFQIKLFNVNPARNLQECMMRGRSTILFSATLLPVSYYKQLLGADEDDYEVYAKTIFDAEKRGLFIANDVTSKYTRRNDTEYYRIASYIYRITRIRKGNYMIFFPSYAFLRSVLEIYEEYFDEEHTECLVQNECMDEQGREQFLDRFSYRHDDQEVLLAFCVLGGIFSEGIDLKKDRLIGAIVVGTGFPMVCTEREILKSHFESEGKNGFDYAYRYPGMNKVLQAAGRVIRTAEDIGIVALLDERFLTIPYQRMFPREWKNYVDISLNEIESSVERFWNKWA